MQVSRKTILAGTASTYATLGILRFPAGAAEFSYKWGHFAPLTNPIGARSKEAADKIAQDSGGRLEIKIFPSYQLGNDQSMLTQMRAGALEFQTLSNGSFAQVVPVVGITLTPFAFENYKQAWNAIDGPLGVYLRNAVRKAGFYIFEKQWDFGFLQVVNSVRPIAKPDDLKGLKLRVFSTPVEIAAFKALGASPTPLPGPEVYTALQTHLLDGLDSQLNALESLKFYEVVKYVSKTYHAWPGNPTLASPDAMQRLPKNLRDIVERRVNEYGLLERADIERGDEMDTATLRGRGLVFTQPDLPAFKAVIRAAGLYAQWRDDFGAEAWTALEKSRGKLA